MAQTYDRRRCLRNLGAALACAFTLMAAQAQKPDTSESKTVVAEKEAFERVCGACHATTMINSFHSEPDWRETVNNMIETGAKGSEEDFQRVMQYLAHNWTKIDLNTATAGEIAAALGIKDELAGAVVKYRTDHGPFTAIAGLKKVPGLAQVNFDDRKERIVISNPEGKENR